MVADRGLGVGIGGFGAIGMAVGRTLDAGYIPGMYLAAVSANDQSGAAARMADYVKQAPVMELSALADHSDVVIECAPPAVFRDVAEAADRVHPGRGRDGHERQAGAELAVGGAHHRLAAPAEELRR